MCIGSRNFIKAIQNDTQIMLLLAFFVYITNLSALAQFETKLLASDGIDGDNYGYSVSISGDTAVIGTPYSNSNGKQSGSAYIYKYNGTNWMEEEKLIASDGAAYDYFGKSVSISGNVVVIGALGDDDYGQDTGSAYIFRYNGSNWVEEVKLLSKEDTYSVHRVVDRYFGGSVSISGDVVVIGVYGDNDFGSYSGSAYVFRFNGSNWIREAKLNVYTGTTGVKHHVNNQFGESVSLSGNLIAIGASGATGPEDGSGVVYIFRYDGTDWLEESMIMASDGEDDDWFGAAVSISGEYVIVGAASDDNFGKDSGSAYIYKFDGSNWIEETKLIASDGREYEYFGNSVAIFDNIAVVGSFKDEDIASECGSAYTFRNDGTNWIEDNQIHASDAIYGEHFGTSVSISNNSIVIGAPWFDDNGFESGSAYIYDLK